MLRLLGLFETSPPIRATYKQRSRADFPRLGKLIQSRGSHGRAGYLRGGFLSEALKSPGFPACPAEQVKARLRCSTGVGWRAQALGCGFAPAARSGRHRAVSADGGRPISGNKAAPPPQRKSNQDHEARTGLAKLKPRAGPITAATHRAACAGGTRHWFLKTCGSRQHMPVGQGYRSPKIYAVGLEKHCPGGACHWVPEIPSGIRVPGFAPRKYEPVHKSCPFFLDRGLIRRTGRMARTAARREAR
jgi:hypothetical protein